MPALQCILDEIGVIATFATSFPGYTGWVWRDDFDYIPKAPARKELWTCFGIPRAGVAGRAAEAAWR